MSYTPTYEATWNYLREYCLGNIRNILWKKREGILTKGAGNQTQKRKGNLTNLRRREIKPRRACACLLDASKGMNQSIPALSKLDGSVILALSKRDGNQSINRSAFQAGINQSRLVFHLETRQPLILSQNQRFHLETRQSFNPAASFNPLLVANSACFDPTRRDPLVVAANSVPHADCSSIRRLPACPAREAGRNLFSINNHPVLSIWTPHALRVISVQSNARFIHKAYIERPSREACAKPCRWCSARVHSNTGRPCRVHARRNHVRCPFGSGTSSTTAAGHQMLGLLRRIFPCGSSCCPSCLFKTNFLFLA